MSDIAARVKKIVVEHLGVEADKMTEDAKFIDDLGADRIINGRCGPYLEGRNALLLTLPLSLLLLGGADRVRHQIKPHSASCAAAV
jgi:hypothetical protein